VQERPLDAHSSSHLLEGKLSEAAQLEGIDRELASLIEDSHVRAEASPMPAPETATQHVFAAAGDAPAARSAPAGPAKTRELTYIKATLEALGEEMAKNPGIFVLGEGAGKRGGNFATTLGLFDIYGPERLVDTPICERGFMGLACGAAMTGTRPMVARRLRA